MIARIQGVLIYKSVSHVVVDAHGVGYRISVPLTTFYELPDVNQLVTLHIYTAVKSDAIDLFGFHDYAEKDVFQLLISVSGIGPKLAMNILSGIAANELIRAVSQGDLNRLTRIPGVGKKTAGRMILELKDKMIKLGSYEAADKSSPDSPMGEMKQDALSALVNLGYKNVSVEKAIERIIHEAPEPITLEDLIKKALKILFV